MTGPPAPSTPTITSIKDLRPGMNSLNLNFIVIDIGRAITTKENQEVRTVKVADRTGMCNLSLWNEPGKLLQPGDIVRMTRGYTGMFKNCLTIYTTKFGDFHKTGDFCMIFSETPNMSEPNPELAAQYEKEEAERKAELAARKNRDNHQNRGGGGAGGGESRGGGGGGGKTWGSTSAGSGSGSGGDPRKRGSSKEKR